MGRVLNKYRIWGRWSILNAVSLPDQERLCLVMACVSTFKLARRGLKLAANRCLTDFVRWTPRYEMQWSAQAKGNCACNRFLEVASSLRSKT